MDRAQASFRSTSFQQVEDWLRGLGLLQYAQSFYDNGYEDVDTCKEINAEDLDVIGVKGERDRNDILIAVEKLKQNIYFVLDPEPVEKPEPVKFDPIILKSKLKETLKARNIQLIEPPYYNPDGTFGDLYPLAIKLAEDLSTHFSDVLDALDQLRNRQLPVQTYDDMSNDRQGEGGQGGKNEKRGSVTTLNDPAEYLNCEVNALNRGHSFSKYDTRATKSTTDLSKGDVHHERSHSAGSSHSKYKINPPHKAHSEKGKSRFGSIFARKETVKGQKSSKEQHFDFKANDLALSQSELCDMMTKVKKNEMSQDEVLAAVKKRTASGDAKMHPSMMVNQEHVTSGGSLGKPRKSTKINKNMIKRTPSATFYSKDDTPYNLPADETSSLERTRSGSSLGGEVDSLTDSNKSSPDLKSGLLTKLRSSIRKKGKTEEDDSLNSSLSSQENIAMSDASGKNSPEVRRHDISQPPPMVPPKKPEKSNAENVASNVYQHPTPILTSAAKSAPPVPPSKPRNHLKGDEDWEVFADDGSSSPLKIKEYTKYQESSRRRSDDQINIQTKPGRLPGKGMILDLDQSKLKPVPKAAPRLVRTSASSDEMISTSEKSPLPSPNPSQRDSTHEAPSTPVAKPRKKTLNKHVPATPDTPVESIGIDDIDEKMNSIIAGLDDRLNDIDDNYLDDTQLDNMRQQTEVHKPKSIEQPKKRTPPKPPPLSGKPQKKPLLPPRPPSSGTPPRKPSVDNLDIRPQSGPLKPPHGKARESGEKVLSKEETEKTDALIQQVSQELAHIRKDSMTSHINKSRVKSKFKVLPLKRIVLKKLTNEDVRVHQLPYTSKKGAWQIPRALVDRYAEELSRNVNDVVTSLEEIRVEECKKANQAIIPYTKTTPPLPEAPNTHSLNEWLISVGLPMFIDDLHEVQVTTIEDVCKLEEKDFEQIGVYHDTHIALLMALSKEQVKQSSIVYF